jgi:N-carbamoylputrescine amidase
VKLAVCEAPAEMRAGDEGWQRLVEEVRALEPDVLLLNEMPFGRWVSAEPTFDAAKLEETQRLHDEGVGHLGEFGVPAVIGTRATSEDGRSVNQGFVWSPDDGLVPVHTKQFFPDEDGYYEARWFERGETHFLVADAAGLKIGFLICTEVMFNEWARHYGRLGADLLVVPRATPPGSLPNWKTSMRMAAIVSGCYVASSNRAGTDSAGQRFVGSGWIVNPHAEVIGETTQREPVVTAVVDRSMIQRAKAGYPRYVEELPEQKVAGWQSGRVADEAGEVDN